MFLFFHIHVKNAHDKILFCVSESDRKNYLLPR